MVSRETIAEQFEALGSVPSNIVLDKCVEICVTYGLKDPEEFVEQWMAFSVSNLGGADPTVEYLRQMERKEFNIKKETATKKSKEIPHEYVVPMDISMNNDMNACSSYVNDLNITNPYVKEEKVYTAGAVVCTFGKLNVAKDATWINQNNKTNVDIQVIPNKNGEFLDQNSLYMHDNLMDKCAVIGDNMYEIGQQLCDRYLIDKENTLDNSLSQTDTSIISQNTKMSQSFEIPPNEYSDLSYVNISGQDVKTCIGRVFCDADGHLNSASVMVHSTDDQAIRTCRLNFNNAQSYDIYPGQICMIKGTNPRGNLMFLKDIKTELPIQKPNPPKMMALDGPLHIVIASGPFTQPDNLLYQPFKDLTSYVKQHQPHVVILLGPFIDAQHRQVLDGELKVTFSQLVETLLLDLSDAISNTATKILVVASSRDAVSAEVYPTPPYKLFNKITRPNIQLLPDPCTVNIQGVMLTLTTTDILKHMQEEELIQNVSRDFVKRCIRRIFHTRNMYPIYPPSFEVSLDTQLWSKFCQLNSMPHIMVLPSDNKYFTRDIDGCVSLNPGKVVGMNSGTFSRLEIHPTIGEGHWFEKLACQTIKI